MDSELREVVSLILHKRMALKAELEELRFMESVNLRKSYKREIDKVLDAMNELERLYEKLTNK